MPFDGKEYPETTAKKMLAKFGPHGEHWVVDVLDDGLGGHCLMGCFNQVTTGQPWYPRQYPDDKVKALEAAAIQAGAKPKRGYDEKNRIIETVAAWNNKTTWPKIKLALEYMHEAEIAEMAVAAE